MPQKRSPKAGIAMNTFRLEHGVEIDVCPLTGGVWLDLGELSAMTGLERDLPYFEASVPSSRETIWPSPVADCMLREIQFHPDYDVILDYCPRTGGVWLDAGEIDKVRAIVAALPPPHSTTVTALRALPQDLHNLRLHEDDASTLAVEFTAKSRPQPQPTAAATPPSKGPAVGPDGRRLPPRPRAKKKQ
jgi:Zn-finger nucleic acid-binding protein